jgi:uncharacterized protein YecE (DUF72 family)
MVAAAGADAYTSSMDGLRIGTCSWKDDSWVGLVYKEKKAKSADYLPEYSARFATAEVDSWFYKMPSSAEVASYGAAAGPGLRFTCKAPRSLTVVASREGKPNPDFLSPEIYSDFCSALEPIADRLDAVMLEFEYMNRDKMGSLGEFLGRLGDFVAAVPRALPLAVECRNSTFMRKDYFASLQELGIIQVFSEKIYMPPVASLIGTFGEFLVDSVVVRLLGDERAGIEEATGKRWDRIVAPKAELPSIARSVKNLMVKGKKVTVSVNNHYEGSAPLTVDRFLGFFAEEPEGEGLLW